MNKCANPDCQCEACDCGDNCKCSKDHKCHEGCHCDENHSDKTVADKSDEKCSCSDEQDTSF